MTKTEEIESRKNLELNKQDKFILELHQELIRERQIINNKNEEIERLKQLYETDKESWKEQMYELEKKYKIMKTNANQLAMKIDKAVEYIKNNQWYSVDYGDNILDAKEILDILKGDL